MIKISELFNIEYGNGFELNSLDVDEENGLNFISRTSKNNGVSARVARIMDIEPSKGGTITVSLGGSVLEAFLQTSDFYSGYHIFCLSSKIDLTDQQKLFYCMCIRANKYRYSYGRQANKTLGDIIVPTLNEFPNWVEKVKIPTPPSNESLVDKKVKLDTTNNWKYFRYDEAFIIEKGFYNKKPDEVPDGDITFIGASEFNNGITSKHTKNDVEKIFQGNCITVANDGNSVTSSFYQKEEFTCSHSVNIIRLKNYTLTKYIAMFLCSLIKKEKFRFSYGRKWRIERMGESLIKLPVDKKGNPDWEYMENYIKSLPYSSNL